MKRTIPIIILIGLLFTNCSTDDNENYNPSEEFPQTIKARTFEMNTPKGWELIEDQGIDTYIGRIKNEDRTVFFDQGYLSFGNLANVQENDETIYFGRLEINGVPAIIHKENRPDETSVDTRLSVYLDNGEKQNRLYVINSNDDEFFINLFKTHKFL